jgi:N-acetylglucosamine-6-phosphate deacetylase
VDSNIPVSSATEIIIITQAPISRALVDKSGFTLYINKGLRILVEEALVPFYFVLNSCTIIPAKCLHLDVRKGSIQLGKDADLMVLEDNYDVLQTYCMGQPKLGFNADTQADTKEIANMEHPLQEMMDKRRQGIRCGIPS